MPVNYSCDPANPLFRGLRPQERLMLAAIRLFSFFLDSFSILKRRTVAHRKFRSTQRYIWVWWVWIERWLWSGWRFFSSGPDSAFDRKTVGGSRGCFGYTLGANTAGFRKHVKACCWWKELDSCRMRLNTLGYVQRHICLSQVLQLGLIFATL